jgi:hypothetical protein
MAFWPPKPPVSPEAKREVFYLENFLIAKLLLIAEPCQKIYRKLLYT